MTFYHTGTLRATGLVFGGKVMQEKNEKVMLLFYIRLEKVFALI